MTKPFDEQYVKDRDKAAERLKVSSLMSFREGSDWSKQYFDAKVAELESKVVGLENENETYALGAEQFGDLSNCYDAQDVVSLTTRKHDELKEQITTLEQRVEGLREALKSIQESTQHPTAIVFIGDALKRDDEMRGAK
jgi:hypothetical protein